MSSLIKMGTWTIVDLPPSQKPIGCMWRFKTKQNSDGTVERLKARLVARGDAQVYGINYTETFSPVIPRCG